MATSITYKGSELASFSNNTKTLKTAGKYLEGDITISASTVLGTTTVIPSETTQTISPASGQEGLSSVTVNGITNTYVGSSVPTGSLTVAGPTVTASAGYYVDAATETIPNANITPVYNWTFTERTITVNESTGLITARGIGPDRYPCNFITSSGYVAAGTTFNVGISLPASTYLLSTQSTKTIRPSESQQTAVTRYKWTTGTVTVAAITPTYVGSGVTTNPTITISGPTVTVPSGYYDSQQTKTIADAVMADTITIPFTAVNNFSIDGNGLITATRNYMAQTNAAVKTDGYVKFSDNIRIELPKSTSTYQLPTLPAQSFTPSSTTQTVASTGKYMLGDITVQPIPSEYVVPTGVTTITSNGTHNVTSFASASVNVQPTLQAKTFTPSETSTTITADAGNDGLSSVTVAGITNTYVGSGIAKNPTITVSGPSVTIPAGYYSSQQTKTVASGSVDLGIEATVEALPTITVSASGLITALNNSTGQVEIEVNPGYISGNTTGTIGIAGESTRQLSTQGATTVIPSETAQTLSVNQKYMTGNVTVAAITSTYVGSGITRNPTVTVSGPSVTIPAGYYSSQQTKTVASGSVSTPSTTITANPTVNVSNSGLITASVTGSSNVAPSVNAGYISSGTAGTISVTGSTTLQLTTQGSTTVTPSTTTQTVNVTGKYMTGNVTVNPIPSQYIVPSGTYTISSVDSTNTFNVTNYASAKVTITDADNIAY